jgi:hypothetical protein
MPLEWAQRVSPTDERSQQIPTGLRVAGLTLRAVFIACLLAVTIRVSAPQNETIWTAYDTPADLVRMALGLGVCVWIAAQLFRLPKDADAYRTWVYLGFAAVPFAIICVLAIWRVI